MRIDYAMIKDFFVWLLWGVHVERFRAWLIKQLTSESGVFSVSDINEGTKTIHMGFYSIKTAFIKPTHELMLWALWKYYGYTFAETRFEFPQFMKPVNKIYRTEACDATCQLKYLSEKDGRVPCCKTWRDTEPSHSNSYQ